MGCLNVFYGRVNGNDSTFKIVRCVVVLWCNG